MRKDNIFNISRVSALLASAGMASLLGGCAVNQSSYGNMPADNKITVAETIERMELYVQDNGLSLSARDQDAVGNFIAQYSQTGQGPLYLNVPKNIAGGAGVREAQAMLGSYLSNFGITQNAVQTGQYAANTDASAPVVVSYRRLATVPVSCQQSGDLTYTSHNQPYTNYGCAYNANLAALVSDPRQFLAPYDLGPSSVKRRTKVLDSYAKGSATGAAIPSGQKQK